VRRKKRTPQKVKPKPVKAKIWDSEYMEKISEEMPEIRNTTPILLETAVPIMRFDFKSSDLFANFAAREDSI
jgi:ribosomal protein S25